MRSRPHRRLGYVERSVTRRPAQAGVALLAVLVILLVVTGSSASFIWFMNQEQQRAGTRLRSAASIAAAEAGIHRALMILESVSPDDGTPGRFWRPAAYAEPLRAGSLEGVFRLSLIDAPGGGIEVTSAGEVGGTTRRLRARVSLASPALLAAVYGASFIRLERPPAATWIFPYGAGIRDLPWVHLAVGRELWFGTTGVAINNPSRLPELPPGPVDAPAPSGGAAIPMSEPVRLLLARDATLTLSAGRQVVDLQELRRVGVHIEGALLRTVALPPLPEVDGAYYMGLALSNTANADLNRMAGEHARDNQLASKRDSVYTPAEVERIQTYAKAARVRLQLRGVVYVTGAVSLVAEQQLQILDGALITDGIVYLRDGASLEITHDVKTRMLPGLIINGTGALYITRDARLRVHGLLYVNRGIDITEGARADVVGAVMGNDAGLSLRNLAATVVVRYDPAVLGTPGLRVGVRDPVVAWVALYEELP